MRKINQKKLLKKIEDILILKIQILFSEINRNITEEEALNLLINIGLNAIVKKKKKL